MNNENTCVFCGRSIPEGRMVCPQCERRLTPDDKTTKEETTWNSLYAARRCQKYSTKR